MTKKQSINCRLNKKTQVSVVQVRWWLYGQMDSEHHLSLYIITTIIMDYAGQ